MSFRPGSRIFSAFRTNFRQYYARRNASTAPGAEPSGFAKFWASPVGPKTVHFWYDTIVAFQAHRSIPGNLFANMGNRRKQITSYKRYQLTVETGLPS